MLRKLFIPSLQNDLRPYSLRPTALNLVAILILGSEILLISYLALAFAIPNFSLTASISNAIESKVREAVPEALVEMTNDYRAERGLKPLVVNASLQAAAQAKAEDMAARGYFSHQGPLGEPAWDWLDRSGYKYRQAGENLAVNFSDAAEVMRSWIDSPGHEANLSNRDLREVGVGIARGRYEGHPTTFVVQFFGRPARVVHSLASEENRSRQGALVLLAASPRTLTSYFMIFAISLLFILLGVLLGSLFFAHRAVDWDKRLWEPFLLYRLEVIAVLAISLVALGLLCYNNSL